MFGVDSSELLLIVLIAVVVVGPKDLPRMLGSVGRWVGKARGMANQFKSGVNDMVRDTEIAELEKKWREQNEAIMRANPLGANAAAKPDAAKSDSGWGLPAPPDEAAAEQATSSLPAEAASPSTVARPAPGAPAAALNGHATPVRAPRSIPRTAPDTAAEPVTPALRSPPRAPVATAASRPAPRPPTRQ